MVWFAVSVTILFLAVGFLLHFARTAFVIFLMGAIVNAIAGVMIGATLARDEWASVFSWAEGNSLALTGAFIAFAAVIFMANSRLYGKNS